MFGSVSKAVATIGYQARGLTQAGAQALASHQMPKGALDKLKVANAVAGTAKSHAKGRLSKAGYLAGAVGGGLQKETPLQVWRTRPHPRYSVCPWVGLWVPVLKPGPRHHRLPGQRETSAGWLVRQRKVNIGCKPVWSINSKWVLN
jgi:hypothetical protein